MSTITSIEELGVAPVVFDPACSYPHAYISDGFVSHNCVVLFDEVEKLFQSQSDSGVTSSLLSQLLWWLQEHKTKVFSVMTTNNMETIPPELYREGRIDGTMEFLGVETQTEGYEFCKGALDSMSEGLETKPNMTEAYKELNKRVKSQYIDEAAVPQAKLTQLVYSLVREIV